MEITQGIGSFTASTTTVSATATVEARAKIMDSELSAPKCNKEGHFESGDESVFEFVKQVPMNPPVICSKCVVNVETYRVTVVSFSLEKCWFIQLFFFSLEKWRS